jgi:hypothetical protein
MSKILTILCDIPRVILSRSSSSCKTRACPRRICPFQLRSCILARRVIRIYILRNLYFTSRNRSTDRLSYLSRKTASRFIVLLSLIEFAATHTLRDLARQLEISAKLGRRFNIISMDSMRKLIVIRVRALRIRTIAFSIAHPQRERSIAHIRNCKSAYRANAPKISH